MLRARSVCDRLTVIHSSDFLQVPAFKTTIYSYQLVPSQCAISSSIYPFWIVGWKLSGFKAALF